MPQYVAEPLLHAEGFTAVEYAPFRNIGPSAHVPAGEADMAMDAIGPVIMQIDAGEPLVLLAGIHLGCYELFGGAHVHMKPPTLFGGRLVPNIGRHTLPPEHAPPQAGGPVNPHAVEPMGRHEHSELFGNFARHSSPAPHVPLQVG